MLGEQITARKLTGLKMHHNDNYATRELEAQLYGQYAKTSRPFIHQHILTNHPPWDIYPEHPLVLSCEPHQKCKPKATDNCVKRTLHKVNNPCTRRYKHRCFPPGGNITSPSLMFLSLKLDIGGLNWKSSITLPLGVTINHLAKVINGNREHAIITQELKYKRE